MRRKGAEQRPCSPLRTPQSLFRFDRAVSNGSRSCHGCRLLRFRGVEKAVCGGEAVRCQQVGCRGVAAGRGRRGGSRTAPLMEKGLLMEISPQLSGLDSLAATPTIPGMCLEATTQQLGRELAGTLRGGAAADYAAQTQRVPLAPPTPSARTHTHRSSRFCFLLLLEKEARPLQRSGGCRGAAVVAARTAANGGPVHVRDGRVQLLREDRIRVRGLRGSARHLSVSDP